MPPCSSGTVGKKGGWAECQSSDHPADPSNHCTVAAASSSKRERLQHTTRIRLCAWHTEHSELLVDCGTQLLDGLTVIRSHHAPCLLACLRAIIVDNRQEFKYNNVGGWVGGDWNDMTDIISHFL